MIKATYIEHMGDDISVLNAARVSFNKETTFTYKSEEEEFFSIKDPFGEDLYLSKNDYRLINFLAREKHLLPFRHPQISLHIKAPVFLIRQLDKHQVGFSTSEISRRYIDAEPVFYTPDVLRYRAEDKKQGSGEDIKGRSWILDAVRDNNEETLNTYNWLLEKGVAPELARIVLPQNMVTEQIKTGSLLGWWHLYQLRSAPDAQKEIQILANQISEIIKPLYLQSWLALERHNVQ